MAAFILVSVVGTPALTSQGVDPLVANMFVFYFALLSHITPPVCLAIFAGAQIAEANIWETAWVGVKMSAVPYVLPFLVIFSPSLLLMGPSQQIVADTLFTAIGLLLIISAIQGWAVYKLNVPVRLLSLAAGASLIWPSTAVTMVGVAFATVVLGHQTLQHFAEKRRA